MKKAAVGKKGRGKWLWIDILQAYYRFLEQLLKKKRKVWPYFSAIYGGAFSMIQSWQDGYARHLSRSINDKMNHSMRRPE